jgi:hypothetical protein
MTIQLFARRVGAARVLGGLGLLFVATIVWSTVGDGGAVVHSIHSVAGSVVAAAGVVLVGIGLTISTAFPQRADRRGADIDG